MRTYRDTNTQGKGHMKETGRDQSDATISQGTPGLERQEQKLEEARKDLPLESSEGAWPCQYFEFRLLASRTV